MISIEKVAAFFFNYIRRQFILHAIDVSFNKLTLKNFKLTLYLYAKGYSHNDCLFIKPGKSIIIQFNLLGTCFAEQ